MSNVTLNSAIALSRSIFHGDFDYYNYRIAHLPEMKSMTGIAEDFARLLFLNRRFEGRDEWLDYTSAIATDDRLKMILSHLQMTAQNGYSARKKTEGVLFEIGCRGSKGFLTHHKLSAETITQMSLDCFYAYPDGTPRKNDKIDKNKVQHVVEIVLTGPMIGVDPDSLPGIDQAIPYLDKGRRQHWYWDGFMHGLSRNLMETEYYKINTPEYRKIRKEVFEELASIYGDNVEAKLENIPDFIKETDKKISDVQMKDHLPAFLAGYMLDVIKSEF